MIVIVRIFLPFMLANTFFQNKYRTLIKLVHILERLNALGRKFYDTFFFLTYGNPAVTPRSSINLASVNSIAIACTNPAFKNYA